MLDRQPRGLSDTRLTASGTRRVSLLAVAITASLAAATVTAAAATSTPVAHAARALAGTVTATLHLIKPDGSELIEEGPVSGLLHGTAKAKVHTGAHFHGTFTIRTSSGSISGSGTATPHGSQRYQSFSGVFTATSGTGRYAHIHGHSGLYGVFDRRNDSVTVQTQGTLYY
jgi:hypothetical protein